ncbi:MAG TPA: alkaline phosphatase family protein [Candidatus Aquilonibacter sp.]
MRRLVAGVAVSTLLLGGCGGGGGVAPGMSASAQSVAAQSATTESASAKNIERGGPPGSNPEMVRLVRSKIKHVFVLIQENHTFDQYFGLYPGTHGDSVENLGSPTAREDDCVPDPVAGGCQRPFLISANPRSPNYVVDAPDITGGNNNRYDQEFAIDHGKMDGYLQDLENGTPVLGPTPTPAQIQSHNESIGIEAVYDCDTIPYLWYYAKNFALFDHYFQANTGDSTPSNIQLFAGQIGQTEAAAGEGVLTVPVAGGGYTDGVPISEDNNPPASQISFVGPYSPDNSTYQSYATMPVMLSPGQDGQAVSANVLGLIENDITTEWKTNRPSIPWAWYEEGLYTGANGFSAHHTAPLYFDYINHAGSPFANKTNLRDNTSTNGFISDIQNGTLPSSGVFWVKGGNDNTYGLTPADPIFTTNSSGNQYYVGDDDHPGSGSSDHQVAEAYLAEVINAIAQSKYWKDSIIIVTWDDSGGFYDHLAPPSFGKTCPQDETGPEAGYACGDGVRLPALVISPYAKNGRVVHAWSDHGSVSKLIETVFGLPTFGSLPNEQAGVAAGLSPADGNPDTSDLTDALDIGKLQGGQPNPPTMAEIPAPSSSPHMSCASLGIRPIDAPAPLPAGYETAGYYLREQLLGDPTVQAQPVRLDGDD